MFFKKPIILYLVIALCHCMDLNTEGMTLDEINDQVLKDSKPFWTE